MEEKKTNPSEQDMSTIDLPNEEDLLRAASEEIPEEEASAADHITPEQLRRYEEEPEDPDGQTTAPLSMTAGKGEKPAGQEETGQALPGGQALANPSEQLSKKRDFRWHLRWIIPLILALIMLILGLVWTSNRKTKIGDSFDVRFEGYDGQGILAYDSDKVNEKMIRLIGKKVGLKKDQIESMINRNTDGLESDPKYQQAVKYLEGTNIAFDKETDLKNGDVVTLKIKSDYDSSPIADETRTYTVSGLTQMQDMTSEQILEKYPVHFTGYNGYGSLDYDQSVYTVEKVYDHLSNGDEVSLPLSNSFLETARKNGKKLAEETLSLKVSGLKDIKDIAKISDVAAKADDLAKSANLDQDGDYHKVKYSINREKTYIYFRNGQMNIMNIYKLVRKESNKDISGDRWTDTEKTGYYIYGYNNLAVKNDAISMSDLEDHAGSLFSSEYVDLAAAKADLAAKNYKEYKP